MPVWRLSSIIEGPGSHTSSAGGVSSRLARGDAVREDTDFVFPGVRLKGKKPLSGSIIVQKYLRPAAVKAGVIKEREKVRFGFHNFRHALATALVKLRVEPCRGCYVTKISGRRCRFTHDRTWRRCARHRANSWSSFWATGFICSWRGFSEKSWVGLRIVGRIAGWKVRLFAIKSFELWWPGTELNRRRQPFQGCALPPELPGHVELTACLPAPGGLSGTRGLGRNCQPIQTVRML
jgi:hypothetical protein